ncbi:hypothetical protein GOB33_18830 [Sinorhizobium meliloti]|nr:hypothetical protein [Sinorhizobium meliloti]
MNIRRLEEYKLTADADHAILWLVRERALNDLRPPYEQSLRVLPDSLFCDLKWIMPYSWFPPGSGGKENLDFLGMSVLADGRTWRLRPESKLLEQLKEIAIVLLYYMAIFGPPLKPASISSTFKVLRKFMHAVEATGCSSLSEITPYNVQLIIDTYTADQRKREILATWVERLVEATELGYIHDGLQDYDFEIDVGNANRDTSKEKGEQPLTDGERQLVLSKVLTVIDNRKGFVEWTRLCLNDPAAINGARDWLSGLFPKAYRGPSRYPEILHRLYHGATGYLFADSFGPRPTELLSAKRGFMAMVDGGPATLLDCYETVLETSKTERHWRGTQRSLRVSRLVFEAGRSLEEMHDLYEKKTQRLFSPPNGTREYSTNNFNHVLRTFCRTAEIPFFLTSYTGRKTLVRNASRVVTNGLAAAKILLDHADRGKTAGYALSNPFVREEIHAESLALFQQKSRTLLESTIAAGGKGLGGVQGHRMEARMAALISDNLGVAINEIIEIFLEELLRQNVIPIPVMRGVLCMKKAPVRGSCSKSTGDTVPDVGNCTADCPYQVQEMYRHDLLDWEIGKVSAEWLKSLSKLQKAYWLNHIQEQLHAWPDLKPKFEKILKTHPELAS